MSGDTILAIIAVSLTAIFISVFAIECDRVYDKGFLTIKDWLRKLRRENDPREPIVKAFRAARKAAEALLTA